MSLGTRLQILAEGDKLYLNALQSGDKKMIFLNNLPVRGHWSTKNGQNQLPIAASISSRKQYASSIPVAYRNN